MSDTKPRAPGCTCHQEEGDSSCPVHGDCANCGETTPFCCSVAMTDEILELRAALEAREAEVKYLRAQRAWQVAADRHTGWGSVGIIAKEWLAANPEPTPPEGVEP